MTEQEWLACTDPQPMMVFLQGETSERKVRLFAVACCRRIWHLLTDERSREAVEVAERFADGTATSGQLSEAWNAAAAVTGANTATLQRCRHFWAASAAVGTVLKVWEGRTWLSRSVSAAESAAFSVAEAAGKEPEQHGNQPVPGYCEVRGHSRHRPRWVAAEAIKEMAIQAVLVHDIFSNPFRPVTLDPTWLTWHDGLLVSMARQMYDSRDFRDMPILADALEEAGCSDQDILGHCRSGGEHVRGCWVVDLLLGKE